MPEADLVPITDVPGDRMDREELECRDALADVPDVEGRLRDRSVE